jgi:hypothetical protein
MKRIFRRAAVAAGSLGVVGGMMLTALPASASISPVASWGAEAHGPVHFGPVAFATFYNTPQAASNANYTNFLTTGLIVDRASRTTAYSLVNSPLVNLSFLEATVRADKVTSWCHTFGRFAVGGATIFNGSVSQTDGISYNPLRNPAPNTSVYFDGATVTFNKQDTVNKVLTVTAIYVKCGPERLSLGNTRCGRGSVDTSAR